MKNLWVQVLIVVILLATIVFLLFWRYEPVVVRIGNRARVLRYDRWTGRISPIIPKEYKKGK